jgi:hypothetical protein
MSKEYATTGTTSEITRALNCLTALEKIGLDLCPKGTKIGLDELIDLNNQVMRKGISIPSRPFAKLSTLEQRNFIASFSGHTEGLALAQFPESKPKRRLTDVEMKLLNEHQRNKFSVAKDDIKRYGYGKKIK